MKKIVLILNLLVTVLLSTAQSGTKRVLVFTKVMGYFHESIPDGIKAIQKLGTENDFAVDLTKDSTYFTDKNLKKYAAIIFLNTSGRDLLNRDQQMAMERYIQAGGGFVGVHCAACNYTRLLPTETDWPWYHRLIGATFTNHPAPAWGTINVIDRKNSATKHLPKDWLWYEEWYNFKDIQPDLQILLKVDEATYKGGENGANHPLAWYHEFDGGRSFYTGQGHFGQAYTNPLFVKELLEGIRYAMGKNVVLDYNKVKVN